MARLRDGSTGDAHNSRPQTGQRTVNPTTESGSTILFKDCATFLAKRESYFYGRHGTPTHRAFEENLMRLEGAAGATLTPSGLAAVSLALLSFSKSGGHVLITDNAYDPVRSFCDGYLSDIGVETTYYDPAIGRDIRTLIRPNTCAILAESPGSQTFEVHDLPAIIEGAGDVPVLVDNTWAAGVFLKPLQMGATLSIQAITKYIGGHSDLLMGAVLARTPAAAAKVAKTSRLLGNSVSAQDVALAHRGLRTLHRRLDVHQASGLEIAKWLADQPHIRRVLHPALPSHPGHELWRRDFTGASGLFGAIADWTDDATTIRFIDTLELFGIGYSWGGFESLCIPATPARTAVPWTEAGTLLRFHIGLEHPQDLIDDLSQGFDAIGS